MPTTWDFPVYLCAAKTLGYDEIRFVIGKIATYKYSPVIALKRWANILIPLCYMEGMPYSVCDVNTVKADVLSYAMGYLTSMYEKLGRIELFQTRRTHEGYVTITLRESFRNPWRNSDLTAWAGVKKRLEERGKTVIVLPECEAEPIHVTERMRIYSGAEMNMGVSGAGLTLCWLSDLPYMSFLLPNRKGYEKARMELIAQHQRLNFPIGTQLPWRNGQQELVWKGDDFETIMRHYDAMAAQAEAA